MKASTWVALIVFGLLLLAVGYGAGRATVTANRAGGFASTASTAAVTPIPTADTSAPALDVPGDDIPGLPRFPGMTRVEYRQVILGELLETEVEYVMAGDLEPVHDFYRGVFDDEGWSVADLHIFQGEWTFFVIDGDREALVEIESRGPLVEVELELVEPPPAESP